ncbi:unnamed protein product [[Actinomadura] parvosata subsp. kistnae]|nr:unnamed protein product [Actinomadura parvosata subsp. kistnae]
MVPFLSHMIAPLGNVITGLPVTTVCGPIAPVRISRPLLLRLVYQHLHRPGSSPGGDQRVSVPPPVVSAP